MSAPGSTGWFLLRWLVAFTVVCSVFLVLRLWAARLTRRPFHADDAFVILSFVSYHPLFYNKLSRVPTLTILLLQMCTIANEGVIIWAICNGLGKPSDEVPPDELVVQAKVRDNSNLSEDPKAHLY